MSATNWMEKTIIPKSDQLNAEDLLTGPLTVTVTGVREGNSEQSMVISISGPRKLQPFKPCKTMRRVLIRIWGKEHEGADWPGRKMTLYTDPQVKWSGEEVGGIRISHMSGIDKPVVLKLTETRGKRVTVTILPLPNENPAPETLLDRWRAAFRGAPKPVLAITKTIGEAFNKREQQLLDQAQSDTTQIEDAAWRKRLTDFAAEVGAEMTPSEAVSK